MKAFVTGGAGFIGSHLVDRLINEGNEVTVYDNFSSGKEAFIKHHEGNPNFRLIRADLLNLETLEGSMRGHDVIFHLAANPDGRAGIAKTDLDLKQNTLTTYNVLEAMRRNDVKKIVFTSSGTVYGDTPPIPIKEDYGPLLPISLYGASKLACEGLITAFAHIFGIRAWIFRLGNVVGDRSTHGVIYDLVKKLKANPHVLEVLGDGNQTKPYIHVDDCVDGMLFAFKKACDEVNVFNLAVETVTSVKQIVDMLLSKIGLKDVEVHYTGGRRGWPGDVPHVMLSVEKMKRLGWAARYSSNGAVAKAIDSLVREIRC